MSSILYVLLLFTTFTGSIASLFFKKASVSMDIRDLFKNLNLYIGGALYVLSAVLNIVLLKYLDYSIVLPLTSLTYLWTLGVSYMILKEKISKSQLLGVFLILTGAVLITI